MKYAYINQLENVVLYAVMELITIPIMIVGSVVAVVVVYRYINKKTKSRTLSMMAVLFSLMTAVLIGYMSV